MEQSNPIEKCVVCGNDTKYHFNDHIDIRYGYVEGVGQICKECYEKTEQKLNRYFIDELATLSHQYPNNQELGEQVRRMVRDNEVNEV